MGINKKPEVDETAENTKYLNKMKNIGIEYIGKYLYSMGFINVMLVEYNDWCRQLISALKDTKINLFLCTEAQTPELPEVEGVKVSRNTNETLKNNDINLVVDMDKKKYSMRRYVYDGFQVESCLFYELLKKIITDERFRWQREHIKHQREMLEEFFDILKSRYTNVAVYGTGIVPQSYTEHFKRLFPCVEVFTKNDILISEKGEKIEIIKYSPNEIHTVFYFGICVDEVNFYKSGKKISVINYNQLLQEISMNYDLAWDIIPKLENKGVSCFNFLYPDYYRLNGILRSVGSPYFRKKPLLINMFQDVRFKNDLRDFFCEYYSQEYIQGILRRPSVIEINGIKKYNDFKSPFYHTTDGKRITTDTPPDTKYTIHFFGKCAAMGRFVEDKNTIPSFLQRLINESTLDYRVINYGVEAEVEINKKIRNICFKKGDIVIVLYRYYDVYKKRLIKYIDLSGLICDFVIQHREYFLDTPEHFNHRVNESIAYVIQNTLSEDYSVSYDILSKEEYFYVDGKPPEDNHDEILENEEFSGFIAELKKGRRTDVTGKIGSIVMNCNPFTLGHRYLIEQAASQCELLYIFVVEEDKSFFKFKDRFMLVKQGTSDLPNVEVRPSGNFMISALTFPEYFTKDAPSEISVDPSNDVELFAKYIAPALGIKARFAGEEPLDAVTNKYNETMSRIFPQYGIEFNVIARKQESGNVISASRVRKCLENQDFDEIKNIVPVTTYNYLVEKFANNPDAYRQAAEHKREVSRELLEKSSEKQQ